MLEKKDLEELERKLDIALAKETPESMRAWLDSHTNGDVDCEKCRYVVFTHHHWFCKKNKENEYGCDKNLNLNCKEFEPIKYPIWKKLLNKLKGLFV